MRGGGWKRGLEGGGGTQFFQLFCFNNDILKYFPSEYVETKIFDFPSKAKNTAPLRGSSGKNSPVSWQLPLIMIFKDHHSKLKFTLPKYPRSQNLTPLSPPLPPLGEVKVAIFAVFHGDFYPGCPFFRPNFFFFFFFWHVIEVSVWGISLNRSP